MRRRRGVQKAYIDAKKEDIILQKAPVGTAEEQSGTNLHERVMYGENIPPKSAAAA